MGFDFAAHGLPDPPKKPPETAAEKFASLRTALKILSMSGSYIEPPILIGTYEEESVKTYAGALQLVERGKQLITDMFMSQGLIPLTAFIFSRMDIQTGAPARNVYVTYLTEDATAQRKETLAMMLKFMAYLCDADATIFASETWMVTAPKESMENMLNGKSLEHHPNRTENLFMLTEHRSLENKNCFSQCPIRLDANGNRTLGLWTTSYDGVNEGRFVNLLHHKPEN